jgi:hypothetical protein
MYELWAAEPELAGPPGLQSRARVRLDHDGLGAGKQPADRAVAHRVLRQGERRSLGHAEALRDGAPQPLLARLLHLPGARSRTDEHEAQRRELEAFDERMLCERARDRRHHDRDAHAMLGDRAQEGFELEARERHHPRADAQRGVQDHRPEHMREGGDAEDDVFGAKASDRRRREQAQRRNRSCVGVRRALGQAGGPTRAQKHGERPRIDDLRRVRLAGRKRAEREDRVNAGSGRRLAGSRRRRSLRDHIARAGLRHEGTKLASRQQRAGGRKRQARSERPVNDDRKLGSLAGHEDEDIAAPGAARSQARRQPQRSVQERAEGQRPSGGSVEDRDATRPLLGPAEHLVVEHR